MIKSLFKNNVFLFILFSIVIFFLYTVFLSISGYFEIGLLSDDFLNFSGAQNSTLIQKFTSNVPFINTLHFRPLYYLSISFSMWINEMLNTTKGNFIIFRIENLFFFYTLIFLSSYLLFRISKNLSVSIVLMVMCLVYPSNLNDICWTVGKNDLMCGVFLITALIFTFSYLDNRSQISYYLTALFFVLGLLTKETSVILPFITIMMIYLVYGKEKVFELKRLLGMEIFIFIAYLSFRVYILGVQPAEVVTKFQKPGLFSSAGVTFKAALALTFPYDYLSIQSYFSNHNLLFLTYLILIFISLVALIFIFIRTNNFRYLAVLVLIFMISISPNLIAGYFRPQLIFIPFILFNISLLIAVLQMKINLKFYFIMLVLILGIWSKLSFNVIQEWRVAYYKSVTTMRSLVELDIDPKKRNIFIGLPSRFQQASILDYSMGAYNYWKYGDFKIRDKIIDLINTGALDAASLNSEISINKFTEDEYEIITSGETQYFLILDSPVNKYKDKDISLRLSEKNTFRKPTVLRLRMLTDDSDIYAFNNNKFVKLSKKDQ